MSCAACHRPLCDHSDLIFAGLAPAPDYAHPPARNGADAPLSIGPDRSPNRHGARRTTRPFLRPSALTTPVNTLYQKGISNE